MIGVLSWIIPGAGHFALGKLGRGLLFVTLIAGSFVLGLVLQGRLYTPVASDPQTGTHVDLISTLWTFAQLGCGGLYMFCRGFGFGVVQHPGSPTYEYGNTFMFLAGLLNYLVVLDAYDIATGRRG